MSSEVAETPGTIIRRLRICEGYARQRFYASEENGARPIHVKGNKRFDGYIDDDSFLPLPADTSGRALPAISAESEPFWTGFSRGELVLLRCTSCSKLVHYPVAGCVWCGAADLVPEAVDPAGQIYSFTVCYLEFGTGLHPPYVVAHIELSVQAGLRLIANVVNCRISDVHIGLPVDMIVVEGSQPLPFYQPHPASELPRAIVRGHR
jgi:uncharacterized OB-fold protein